MKLLNPLRRCGPALQRLRTSPGDFFDYTWEFTRRYFFTVSFIALFGAKLLHLYAHIHSLPPPKFFLWGPTFFFQDVILTLLIRFFTHKFHWRSVAALSALVIVPFSLIMSGMTAANTSFYIVTGAEIHWRQATTFHRDAAAMRTLLTGLTGFLIVEGILLTVAWFLAAPLHRIVGGILTILGQPFKCLVRCVSCVRALRPRTAPLPDPEIYEQIAVDDYLDDKSDDGSSIHLLEPYGEVPPVRRGHSILTKMAVWVPFLSLVLLRCVRPWDPSYMFLSEALPLAPFIGGHRHSPVRAGGLPGDYGWLEGRSTLNKSPKWRWLPKDGLPGFEDWKKGDKPRLHYDPEKDPLHVSNLQNPVLESLQETLSNGNVKIKHVIVLKLESTRSDVFPLRKDKFMWNRIARTYQDKKIPDEVQERIANLTRTAEFLTGFDAGFGHDNEHDYGRRSYGGISARNAFTTGTYTLKSLVGTVCGVTPLVADFNREYDHHIYQPCMPHVLEAFNHQDDVDTDRPVDQADFRSWPWHSAWMQSVTETYDNQDKLTPKLGFHDVVTKESLEKPNATHFPIRSKEVNYYGYPDMVLRDYVSDAIDDAERNHNRLFLTHLTGTTHHPWGMPNDTYSDMVSSKNTNSNEDINKYLNTIGYIDQWLQQIIDILTEKGVADETLLVMAGDHGLSLPNDGGVTPYDNPHIGSFQIPMLFAHPQLPQIEINTPVITQQVVPTILDLLIQSSSLGDNSTHAARDLLSIYEGQSMIRELVPEQDGRQNWQFTVMNTGGSWLAVRSAAHPAYRLVIPLVDDVEWRFTNVEQDPDELHPVTEFNLVDLARTLDKDYGTDAVDWVRDAAHVAEWWVTENWHLYQYRRKH
ncbi:alkaline phosphatase-like protein [Aspergillus sclerotioniger CBS 115572]|uniref:Alkaline phosphatase-like protein n=1 Tax=Aspergillus sclerotioniger CBS 115572 TaxID=1450535 RepID=A0A317V1S7_9EURO|nr:alkaline phosphatase-like protein [Aspergillus sclerotioniger CBS 115572]PWY67599.1 alkaline phosphatase-like protein [Aspergillus sclerotioniger CBS 115572]